MIGLKKGDIDTAARTLWGEARGEGREGMTAVMWVIRNRSRKPGWWSRHPGDGIQDDTLAAVCRDPYQFSCWNPNDPNLPRLLSADESDGTFLLAMSVVLEVLTSRVPDPTGGADHYCTKAFFRSAPAGHWCRKLTKSAEIGNHLFFKE